jgi:3-methyl-2-oxobutanoate hydroxymethyltransferase
MTTVNLQSYKKRGEKIAMLTCYDAAFAKIFAEQGVDILLVGDSLGMVLQGHPNTLSVTLAQMCYHTQMVRAGAPNTLIIADMPINSYEHDVALAINNAQALLEAGANMVKIEGADAIARCAEALVKAGIPVCGHLGFTPQSVEKFGGYKIQGKTDEAAEKIITQAKQLESVGVSAIVLEMIPAQLAQTITATLRIPTIGIGAGVACDGQVLVMHDLLGLYTGPATGREFKTPRFVKNFLASHHSVQQAVKDYVQSVKQNLFPSAEQSY